MNETSSKACDLTRNGEFAVKSDAITICPGNGLAYVWCSIHQEWHPFGHNVQWGSPGERSDPHARYP